jgi:hypothetical protein
MKVKELIDKLQQFDENKEVRLLSDIVFSAETFRMPEMSHEYPYRVEKIEDITEGTDNTTEAVFIHAVSQTLY